jgi:putative peptide zinc metalloprotease protein
MAGSLLSENWYAVSGLKPRLAGHAQIHRRVFRGRLWFVLQDVASSRFHQLTPGAYALVSAMDGQSTVQQIWEQACHALHEGLPSQEEVVQLLSQLHAADVLQCEMSPDIAELFQRFRKQKRDKLRQQFLDPFGLRWSLWNPDNFLERWSPRIKWIWGPAGGLLWLLTVIPAIALAAVHWSDLTENVSDRVFNAQNLIALWFIYPVVKVLHELGHGFATKVGGGRVHELGIMLLAMTPVPFVDASAAYAFPSKWQRALVGAAGILVETWLAALAMFVWTLAEPGLIRAAAFNVMLIAGISTLIVNGNPLMRYDGYHVLADILEMPNLAMRGARYFTYLVDRYIFRAQGLQAPDESASERFWMLLYMPLSFIYRIFIVITLVWFMAGKYFFFGVLMALWGLWSMVVQPLWKAWQHVAEAPSLHRNRDRALRTTVGGLALLLLVIIALPLPFLTRAEGVVWLPEEQIVRARQAGFVREVFASSGNKVQSGAPVVWLSDPALEADLAQNLARVEEFSARYRDSMVDSPTAALVAQTQLTEARANVIQDEAKAAELLVNAHSSGQFLQPDADILPGRHFKRGDIIGYISRPLSQPVIRVLVSQDNIDLVRKRLLGSEVRFVYGVPQVYTASLTREVPAGQDELPSKGLGQEGGGTIATDPRDPHGTRSLQRYFQLDLQLPASATPTPWYGSRVYVRFDHGHAPLAYQWFLRLRQLFLARLNV